MLHSVTVRTLRDGSRSLIGFAAYIVVLVAAIVAIYPSLGHNPSLAKLVQSYPETLKAFIGFGGVVDYSSGIGYLGIELFSLMLPGLLIAAAVGAGARAIAGEEEHATLDLLLANPISRRRVALEKAGAMFLTLSLLSLVTFAALAVATAAAGMDVTLGHLAAAAFAVELLALLYGALALMVGAASGRSGLALAVAGAAAAPPTWQTSSVRSFRRSRPCGRLRRSTSTRPSIRSGTGSPSSTQRRWPSPRLSWSRRPLWPSHVVISTSLRKRRRSTS